MFEQTDALFEEMYETTYKRTAAYVAARCGDLSQVEDILQDVYAQLYTVLCTKGAAYVQDPLAFVLHVAKTRLRHYYGLKQKLQRLVPLFLRTESGEELPHPALVQSSFEDAVDQKALLQSVAGTLLRFPPETQKIFYLYYHCDMKLGEVAHALHLPESTVKSKLYRAVQTLRTLYQGGDNA